MYYTIISGILCVVVTVAALPLCNDIPACHDLINRHDKLVQREIKVNFASNVTLNEREQFLDDTFLRPWKQAELRNLSSRNDIFTNLLHQLKTKQYGKNSKVFNFIHQMPKGGDLHIHDVSIVDIDWVIKSLTYMPHLYYCNTHDKFVRFNFSNREPTEKTDLCEDSWKSVTDERNSQENFDKFLLDKLVMSGGQEEQDTDWSSFIGAISSVTDLVYTLNAFRKYTYQSLLELYEDNVLYMEMRTLLLPLRLENGTTLNREYTLQQYIEISKDFKKEHPDFIGAKFIFISPRNLPKEQLAEDIKLAMDLHERYPEHMIGFDLVGHEDLGPPLSDLLDILIIPNQENRSLPFFFHAGETNENGMSTDDNLLYAVLMDTKRIGHGYALTKHPVVMEIVKDRKIPIEVNPLSNEILGLVSDLRNHPGAILFSEGFPVVICSDDPAPWQAKGLSHDYYAAFMAFSKMNDGLATLKEISFNGIRYSAMGDFEKSKAQLIWQQRWNKFIDSIYKSEIIIESQGENHEEL